MFYKLMYKRSFRKYRKSYFNILSIFIVSLSMLSFTNIFCDSSYNYDNAVLLPILTEDCTCDIRVKNISKEEAALYFDIPDVTMKYIDGNLDFYMLDPSKFDTISAQIRKIFNSHIDSHAPIDSDSPGIYIYYGWEPRIDIDNGTRIGTAIFQIILTVIAVVTMVLIYSDYIEQRTEDIRTLSAVGITERQLRRMFFGECNILYLISVFIGIPIGALIAYLTCTPYKWVDMSKTNAIYPVFDLNIVSLIISALLGYIAICITFQIVLKKILKIDASYTCAEAVTEFNPDKERAYYEKSDRHFTAFFAAVLRRRTSSKTGLLTAAASVIIALSVFMLNAVNYMMYTSNSYGDRDAAAVAAGISNSSLFIMVIVYAVIYSLVIVYIFMKRRIESNAKSANTLYLLGADESTVYSCFHNYTVQKIIVTEISGFAVGYAATLLLFSGFNHAFYIDIWFPVWNLAMAAAFYLVYMVSMKKHFNKNCRYRVGDGTEESYGAA